MTDKPTVDKDSADFVVSIINDALTRARADIVASSYDSDKYRDRLFAREVVLEDLLSEIRFFREKT